ncbi:MAG: anaerobic ribonucleoside triphosphate reductase [Thermoprotei archaeon]|nr:anaerobic ribonucleoside triphosphate reductase [Thermoprotei archaeon]
MQELPKVRDSPSLRSEDELGEVASEIVRIERSYIDKAEWEVKENANANVSYSNFLGFLLDKLIKRGDVLKAYLPARAVDAHMRGDIHIHKLPHSLWIPYCAGWSLQKLLTMGLKTPTILSKPAKHLDTAVSHLVNFFFLAAQEWSGAQAVSAFDVYMAPFVKIDNLNEHAISQAMQRLLYELNYPARTGYQSPFSNITLAIDSVKTFLDTPAIVGGKVIGTAADFVDEILAIDKVMFKLYIRGDEKGQPFTFPIPTVMITPHFDWNGRRWGELSDLIFGALAERGVAYLLNGYATNVEALYAMCCRLTIDVSKINNNHNHLLFSPIALTSGRTHNPRGIWATPDATGSIGVVTLNLPRLAYLSKGDWDAFEELVRHECHVARGVLNTWRQRYARSIRQGFMPMTKRYLGHLMNHYNTIGIVGLPEAVANFLQDPHLWIEGSIRDMERAVMVMKKMVAFIRHIAEEFEKIDKVPYNVEEIPGESTSYRLALLDCKHFKGPVTAGEWAMPIIDGTPFYSNSIVPYYADVPVNLRAKWEGEVQQEFTGGVMMHLFLAEMPEHDALKKFIYRLVKNTKVVYFSITPAISVCGKCSWNGVGIYERCPRCGSSKVDVWSRIVGYYRPVRSWNIGKIAEFKSRVHYKELIAESAVVNI